MARTTDFQSNFTGICTQALRMIGAVKQGDDPKQVQLDEAGEALNQVVLQLNTKGSRLWKVAAETYDTVTSQNYLTLGADTTMVSNLRIRTSTSDVSEPVKIIPMSEYDAFEDKTLTGKPTHAVYERSLIGKIRFYPVPDAEYKLELRRTTRLYDFDVSTDTPDFPTEWEQVLVYALARRLANEYQLPIEERRYLREEFQIALDEVMGQDQEVVDSEFVKSSY